MQLVLEDSKDPHSTSVRSGEDRVHLGKQIIICVEALFSEIKTDAEKYAKFGDEKWVKLKRIPSVNSAVDMHSEDRHGRTPLDLAECNGHTQTIG